MATAQIITLVCLFSGCAGLVGRCILVLTRGICQERLRYWGEDVLVGVTTNDNSLKFVRLGELMPYYWGKAYDHGNN